MPDWTINTTLAGKLQKLLPLRLYIFQVLSAVILLPALVLGPTVIDHLLGKHATPWVHSAVPRTTTPSMSMLPCSNGSNPITQRSSVDLPAPLRPSIAVSIPFSTTNESPLSVG